MPAKRVVWNVKCWGHEAQVVAPSYQRAKALALRDYPQIKRLVKQGAPIRVERAEASGE